MSDNYKQLVDKIAANAHLSAEEVERKVEAKRAKLSGLVSKEGAAQIVAAELGLNFDKERMKISELVQGMKRANVIGKVFNIAPVRAYNKNGREGKVARFSLADEGSNVPVILWDTNHISLIEQERIKEGSMVEISNANVRNGELHLSSFSDIKESKETIEKVVMQQVFMSSKIKDAQPGSKLKTRAFIVQIFEPRFFEVCPQCKKKIVEGECAQHGAVQSEKRALLTVVLDDGTESMRAILFGEQINKLGLSNEEIFSLEKFGERKEGFLGEEKVFSGLVRANQLYNTVEFNIQDIEELNPDLLIQELESGR